MGYHQPYLCLHHAHYFVNSVELVLSANVLSIEEVGPPNVAQEIIADQLLFEALSKLFIVVWSEKIFPILSGLDLGKHELF